ncbi:cell wall-binding repeat-containing protein [Microbacterium sp. bgisy189]|uniref:cell wall-binding repeat-containing protein n=1 Tax=Microbacterium sp. bgisy189 TaxID=3413798 RepID=UPI003EBFB7E6
MNRRPHACAVLLLAVVVGALSTAFPVTAAPAAAAAAECSATAQTELQKRLLAEANAERRSAGAAPVALHTDINAVALAWSKKQAAANDMSHNPSCSSQIPSGWRAAGENVAAGHRMTAVMDGWMGSPGHRKNILNSSYTSMGVGVACSSSGRPYYTQVFAAYPSSVFGDAPRLWGSDRYQTAAAVSASRFAAGVGVVYLANGTAFPDALAGAAAAGTRNAPVLLTEADALPAATAKELARLQPKSIVVLGGTAAVADAVVAAASRYTTGPVKRIAGADRYETSALVANTFAPGISVAYVAAGSTFPDALAGAAAAGTRNAPVLLATRAGIPDPTAKALTTLKPKSIVVLGGTSAISDAVLGSLRSYTGGSVTRQAGADRYATAAKVADTFPTSTTTVYVANGNTFPDALAGAAVAGTSSVPVLLTSGSSIPTATAVALSRLDPKKVVILGGSASISESVRAQLLRYATG